MGFVRIKNKRGQVTIFVILAILIVIIGVLIIVFLPKIRQNTGLDIENPEAYIKNCVEDTYKEVVETISLQGGRYVPSYSYSYAGYDLDYLCYTGEILEPCIIQRPLLRTSIESQIGSAIEEKVQECFTNLKAAYESKNYQVEIEIGDLKTTLLPKKVLTELEDYKLVTTKTGNTEKFNDFKISQPNKIYELLEAVNFILVWESNIGEASCDIIMTIDPETRCQKLQEDDGTRIYILTDRTTLDTFQFATKSLYNPPGII